MKAWSISALSAYETCPKRYYMVSIAKKFSDPPSEAMTWGSNVHKAFEEYLRNGKPFPVGMKNLEVMAQQFGAAGKQADEELVETKIALNAELEPVTYFAKDVWVRSVVDYGIINFAKSKAMVIDWKTGKKKSNDDQLALMGGMLMALDERIDEVDSTFVWLQEPKGRQMEKLTYRREDMGAIWGRFLPRVERFQESFKKDDYPARPSGLCRRYCPVTSCPHHGT
jgi:CRISPR/Cas system-associated exonuclease Cas4 (RecB family)